jgi:predicted nucleotidyltransferase
VSSDYPNLVARATADPDVVGLVLTGSHARGMATAHSDHDVYVVLGAPNARWATTRTPELDTIVLSVADLADTTVRWQRYSYRGALVLLDRLDGRIGKLVRAQATLTPAEADAWTREYLDGYLNFCYRAAKSRRDGRPDAARLDELEAGPWLLETVFALHGRVRPYNKYLRWELDTYPLPPPWSADLLIDAVTGYPTRLLGTVETAARAAGFGDVLDAWDDLELIRAASLATG